MVVGALVELVELVVVELVVVVVANSDTNNICSVFPETKFPLPVDGTSIALPLSMFEIAYG